MEWTQAPMGSMEFLYLRNDGRLLGDFLVERNGDGRIIPSRISAFVYTQQVSVDDFYGALDRAEGLPEYDREVLRATIPDLRGCQSFIDHENGRVQVIVHRGSRDISDMIRRECNEPR